MELDEELALFAALDALEARLTTQGLLVTAFVAQGTETVEVFVDNHTSACEHDRWFAAPNIVLLEAARVARERALPDSWLASLADVMSGETSVPALVGHFREHVGRSLAVVAVTPRVLLALKLFAAAHGREDRHELTGLLGTCGIVDPHEAEDVYYRYFPDDPLLAPVKRMLRELMAGANG